jgi:hypothetical protein
MPSITNASILTPETLAKIDGSNLPTPTVTTPHSFHDRGPARSRKITYVVDQDGKSTWTVQVHVSHDKDRKRFDAVVRVVEQQQDGSFNIERMALMAGVRIAAEPVARFSAKALDAFASSVVAEFPDAYARSEHVRALFDLAVAHRLDAPRV